MVTIIDILAELEKVSLAATSHTRVEKQRIR